MRIDLYDGKYTYVCNDDGSDQHALRYGERWRDLVGDGFVLAMAQKIKKLEQAQPKWISVEDKLPDNHSYVLVLGHGGTQFISLFTNNRFYRQSASKRLDGVTDWMPLPQQPEVKP